MTVKYIEVRPTSDLFAPAVRAFGDIAIIGRASGFAAAAPSQPKDFSNPADIATAFPRGSTALVSNAAKGESAVVVAKTARKDTAIRIGTADNGEDHKVVSSAASAANFTLTLDSPLQEARPSGTAVTEATVGDSALARAVRIAFGQSPPPTKVWGVPVDTDRPEAWDAALTEVAKLNVQFVVLADTPLNSANSTLIGKLASHVAADLGDGKERIGVAMFDSTLKADEAVRLITGSVKSERMVLVAHKSSDDVAAATAGVIAGYRPHISMLLKPISIAMTEMFSDSDIDVYDRNLVNWITSPVLLPGQALYLGEGYTADASRNKKYIDIVRTLDDVSFQIKATLIDAIGDLRISRVGLRTVVTLVQSVLSPLVAQQVIEDFSVVVPLLTLFDKEPADLLPAEAQQIKQARARRSVDMTIQVVYAGAVHRLRIDLVFTG
ncbi:hypothetical protein [Streptomyces sp. A012304]|uniref:hypothetical protein n=1 Tax=Streptomyces sp. A012304 TaxID=375446 RepID=UPI00222F4A01|nr:hypothetical protein [Streptomyces sp. A012304]GKQ37924.1 hypothetical protein ALMP_44590 [Streptomyces sp. A012304]